MAASTKTVGDIKQILKKFEALHNLKESDMLSLLYDLCQVEGNISVTMTLQMIYLNYPTPTQKILPPL